VDKVARSNVKMKVNKIAQLIEKGEEVIILEKISIFYRTEF
jgi:hypothetical protein